MTPQEAGQWMLNKLTREKYLDQSAAAYELTEIDEALTYMNDNGNLAIAKSVLREFSKLTKGDEVVWSRSERAWRFREDYDEPGRMQY